MERSLEERISEILIAIGVAPKIKGYGYLREAIRLVALNPKMMSGVTKGLYPAVAAKYGSSASKVERAIRHAIETAWNRERMDVLHSLFGAKAYLCDVRPTNSEFIALVADKLLLEDLHH